MLSCLFVFDEIEKGWTDGIVTRHPYQMDVLYISKELRGRLRLFDILMIF